MKVYLFRHGQTDWNIPHRMQGNTDIPLNALGLKQARTVAEKIKDLRFDAAFASPLSRAVVTAKILLGQDPDSDAPARHQDIKLQTDDRLMEVGFGVEEGDYFGDVVADAAHPMYNFIKAPDQYLPPEGAETLEAVWLRMKAFFDERVIPLEKSLPEAHVLIVSHGAAIRALTCNLAGRPYAQFWGNTHMDNLALNLIEVRDREMVLLEEAKPML